MTSGSSLVELVRQLIEAENGRDRKKAESILAEDFTAITRARGEEQDQNAMLEEIANPKNPNLLRKLDPMVWERESGDLGVVRSIITTTDRINPQAEPKRFRNTHIFQRHQGRWLCVAWQVTGLK